MEKKYTIGALIGNANSPHTMDLMQGIYHAAEVVGVNVIFFLGIHSSYTYRFYFGKDAIDDYDYQFNIVYDYSLLMNMDALIISYGSLCIFLDELEKNHFLDKFKDIPCVLVEEMENTQLGSSMIIDNYRGMYEVVEHLVKEHGYREFTYLSGPVGNTDADQRRAAFHDVMEKYHLPHEENRIRYGDFSACISEEVEHLLQAYPDMDAMVCANDVMADTVYHVFARHGIVVGRDVAVTGFDDWADAKTMNPPLTTVLQNEFDMGYRSLYHAVELIEEEPAQKILVPARVKIRESCGCSRVTKKTFHLDAYNGNFSDGTYIEEISRQIAARILFVDSGKRARRETQEEIRMLLEMDYQNPENHRQILARMKDFLNGKLAKKISLYTLKTAFEEYLDELIDELVERDGYDDRISAMFRLKGKMQDMISACIIKTNNEQANTYQQETWFLPLISRDMMANMDDCREFYGAAMKKLAALKADSTFLFLFEEPIRHRASDNWVCPQKMYLAAAQVGDQVYSYEEDERPMLTPEEGIQPFFHETNGRQMSIFCLFSEEIQYGFMMTEIAPANLALSYLISMQIANALKFYEVSREQKRTQRKLEKLVTEVNEKNEVLNFISEYDVLTGFLNRRGFMERIMQYNKEHNGEEALMIYADLDHLKEINDCFGHNEGDFAIRSASKMLQQILGEGCIIGRLGGDEFAALCPPCDQEERSRVTMKAKDILWQFNETSGKEYYVEITIGWHSFGCDPGNVFTEILDAADKKLYEAKRKRRPTVVKHPAQ